MLKTAKCLLICAGFLLASTALVAQADDLAPAPYRGDPNTVHAKFDLFGSQGGTVPGGPVQFMTGANPTYPLSPVQPMVGAAQSTTNGILYPFSLPNYIDQEPIKLIRIQYSWFGLPSQGADAFTQAILPSSGEAVQLINSTAPTNISGNIFHRWDDYRIIPNPDSERFEIQFVNADPRWVIFDTISVPEPNSLILLGCSGLLVSCIRRRRD